MLFLITALTDFMGLSVSLWLATYLLARGFTSRLTWRAVVILAALATDFYSVYVNLHRPEAGTSVWRAACLTLALVVWHDLIAHLAPDHRWRRWRVAGVYALGAVTIAVLWLARDLFPLVRRDFLWMARVTPNFMTAWYTAFLVGVLGAIFFDFYRSWRAGLAPPLRFFFLATCTAAAIVVGFAVQFVPQMAGLPRLLQDGLMLAAVGLFGYAVARYEALVQRRTTVQDFPLTGLTVLGLASLYALLAEQRRFAAEEVAFITVLAILTHSGVDLLREVLERLLYRQEGALRHRLRRLARNVGGDNALPATLRRALAVLCQRVHASGGLIAVGTAEGYAVVASLHSRPVGSRVTRWAGEDLFRASGPDSADLVWLAPAYAAGEQVAVVGLGRPRAGRREYSERELDALAEAADWLGLMIVTDRQQATARAQLAALADETHTREIGLQAGPEELRQVLEGAPPDMLKMVEQALRRLDDLPALADSPLAAHLRVNGAGHLERGKAVQAQLLTALEQLRPPGPRPREPLPRAWHGYVALYDAYVANVPNREVTARLYVSDSTFSRIRRKALSSLARAVMEQAPADALAREA